MRLPVINPADISADQKPLFDQLHDSIERYGVICNLLNLFDVAVPLTEGA